MLTKKISTIKHVNEHHAYENKKRWIYECGNFSIINLVPL